MSPIGVVIMAALRRSRGRADMRLVRVAGSGTGLVLDVDDRLYVIDIAASASVLQSDDAELARRIDALFTDAHQSWIPMINNWSQARESLRQLAVVAVDNLRQGLTRLPVDPYEDVRVDPPLPDSAARIFATGVNFPAHAATSAAQMNLSQSVADCDTDAPPWGFYVIPGTIVGTEATVTPPARTRYLDYEAEVAVVLGPRRHQSDRDAVSIWGYTAWNDFSIRDAALGNSLTDHGPLTWSLTKNFRTGNSCGPWMVVDYPRVDTLEVSCSVNREVRQRGNTSQMTHSFGRIAAYVSRFVPLAAGDVIVSGTPPSTAMDAGYDGKFLQGGDYVTVCVDGVDMLINQICFAD